MAEILGPGITHYPPLCLPDAAMSGILRWTLDDPAIPAGAKDPGNWPAAMRKEWANDQGAGAATRHRGALVAGLDRVRARLDEFKPDAVVIWGDDQYENFHEDLIPPFAILAYENLDLRPWAETKTSSMMKGKANVWNEDELFGYRLRGRPDIAKQLVTALIERDFDVSYAYKPLHHCSVPHAFTNSVLFLDYHRKGYDHPTICFPLNCYGRRVVSPRLYDADGPACGLRSAVSVAQALHGSRGSDGADLEAESLPDRPDRLIVMVARVSRRQDLAPETGHGERPTSTTRWSPATTNSGDRRRFSRSRKRASRRFSTGGRSSAQWRRSARRSNGASLSRRTYSTRTRCSRSSRRNRRSSPARQAPSTLAIEVKVGAVRPC